MNTTKQQITNGKRRGVVIEGGRGWGGWGEAASFTTDGDRIDAENVGGHVTRAYVITSCADGIRFEMIFFCSLVVPRRRVAIPI